MQVQEVMTPNPKCVNKSTPLQTVAELMVDCDCGGVPVCDQQTGKLVGFVTDRDIVCRTLAKGLDPLEMIAQDAMTSIVYSVSPTATLDECIQLMEQHKIRRLPVTDQQGKLLGIITVADIASRAVPKQPDMVEYFEEAIEEISQPKVSI